MNRIKTILISLAAIAAVTPATRADELSDLVAAVAASVDTARLASDVITPRFDTRTHIASASYGFDLDASMLDGIFRAMKRETARRMLNSDDKGLIPKYDPGYRLPTLARPGFFRPVPGIITSRYGWRPRFQKVHHGVDMALHVGDTVRVAVSGTVKNISFDAGGYGHYVVVEHADGMETLYGHLHYPLVGQGERLAAGEPLGIGGNSGNSTGPHLHFETRLGGVAIDPMLIFDFFGGNTYAYEEPPRPIDDTPKTPAYSHQSKSLKKESTYIVRMGDTLESISRQAGISVMRLCQLNMLNKNEALPIGRMLKLK